MTAPSMRVMIEHIDDMISKEITLVDEFDEAILKAESPGKEALSYSLAVHEGRLSAFRYMRAFIIGEIAE